jgi:hypothetical protein
MGIEHRPNIGFLCPMPAQEVRLFFLEPEFGEFESPAGVDDPFDCRIIVTHLRPRIDLQGEFDLRARHRRQQPQDLFSDVPHLTVDVF